ncbi:MAG: OmpH family outer membrane protein [Bacteroidales bacterium]|nr:OmpH family outer membrane protein [Bacteroidales bacterium]
MKKILLVSAMVFATMSCFAQKFGHVNTTELVQLCPEADKAREILKASTAEAQATYKEMADEYNTKLEAYQQKSSSWTGAVRESKEKELAALQQRITEFGENVQQEIDQQQQTQFKPIAEKAKSVIESIAKAKGLVCVFETSSLIYKDASQMVDLTPDARKAMNIPAGRTMESLAAELQAQQSK